MWFLDTLQAGINRARFKTRREVYPGPTRGVVVRVITGDDTPEQDRAVPHQVLCDVVFARGGIVRALVMQRGSSVENVSRWVPTPARTNMATGEPIKLTNDGIDPPPSNLEDLDGEIVLVDWIERDLDRPIIIGSLEHPRGRRRSISRYSPPRVAQGATFGVRQHSDARERFVAHQGTTARLDVAGNARLDLRRAGVANDGKTYDAPGDDAGNLDVSLRNGSEVVIRAEDGAPIFRIRAVAGGISLHIGRGTGERILLAGPTRETIDDLVARMNSVGVTLEMLATWAKARAESPYLAGLGPGGGAEPTTDAHVSSAVQISTGSL